MKAPRISQLPYLLLLSVVLAFPLSTRAQWTKITPAPATDSNSQEYVFFSKDEGLSLVYHFASKVTESFRSTDGGNTWEPYGELPPKAWGMQFRHKGLGYIQSDTNLYRSFDGGKTWIDWQLNGLRERGLVLLDEQGLWLGNDGITTSTDEGETWRINPAFKPGAWGMGYATFGSGNYGLVGDADWYKPNNEPPYIQYEVLMTRDGGATWEYGGLSGYGDRYPNQFTYAGNGRWFCFDLRIGDNGKLVQKALYADLSGTAGLDWITATVFDEAVTYIYEPIRYKGHWLAVTREGNEAGSPHRLIHSLDNGESWQHFTQFSLPTNGYYALSVSVDSNELFATRSGYLAPQPHRVYRLEQPLNAAKAQTAPESLRIFPNPANEQITIAGATGEEIRIYDVLGRCVKSARLENGRLDLKEFAPGMYSIEVGDTRTTVVKH